MKVYFQLKVCLKEIAEEENSVGSDEMLVVRIWTYGWFYRSGLMEQIKALASTERSCLDQDRFFLYPASLL